jgi:hypothetical protein
LIDVIPESKSGTIGNSKDQKGIKPEIMEKISKTRSKILQTKKTKSKEFPTNGKPSDCSSAEESPANDGQPDQIRDKYTFTPKKRSLTLNESSDDGGRTPSSETHSKKVFPSILKRKPKKKPDKYTKRSIVYDFIEEQTPKAPIPTCKPARKKYIQKINPNIGHFPSAPNKVLMRKKSPRVKHAVNRNPTPPKARKRNRDEVSSGDSRGSDSKNSPSAEGSQGDSEDGYREYGDQEAGQGVLEREMGMKRGKISSDNTSKNHIYMYPHNVKGLKINITK